MVNISDPVVSFTDVSLRFPNGTTALQDIELDILEGEFVSLLGPSGCGKSTLLRLAAGLESPSAGSVDVATEAVGYVFQEPALLPWRSVRRNVALFAQLEGRSKEDCADDVDRAIELVGLRGFENAKPHQLSGGMSMRVSLARSLVTNPELFLFDEPFGALDEFTRERLNDEVQALYARRPFTGIFVTHSIAEAVFMGSKVAVMGARPGRIIEVFDIPWDFPRDPELRFRAEFTELLSEISHTLGQEMAQ